MFSEFFSVVFIFINSVKASFSQKFPPSSLVFHAQWHTCMCVYFRPPTIMCFGLSKETSPFIRFILHYTSPFSFWFVHFVLKWIWIAVVRKKKKKKKWPAKAILCPCSYPLPLPPQTPSSFGVFFFFWNIGYMCNFHFLLIWDLSTYFFVLECMFSKCAIFSGPLNDDWLVDYCLSFVLIVHWCAYWCLLIVCYVLIGGVFLWLNFLGRVQYNSPGRMNDAVGRDGIPQVLAGIDSGVILEICLNPWRTF